MAKKKLRTSKVSSLRTCQITIGNHKRVGFLYFQNEHSVVLLNRVTEMADLGPLKSIRRRHNEPEADVWIFPRKEIGEIILF